jgi:hypothetical protein
MAANGNLIFQDTNKATFVGANSNVVIDTVNASFGVGVDVNGPTSNLHVVGNAYVTSNLEVANSKFSLDTNGTLKQFGGGGNSKYIKLMKYFASGSNWKIATGSYTGQSFQWLSIRAKMTRLNEDVEIIQFNYLGQAGISRVRDSIVIGGGGSSTQANEIKVYNKTSDSTYEIYLQIDSATSVEVEITHRNSTIDDDYSTVATANNGAIDETGLTKIYDSGTTSDLRLKEGLVGIGTTSPGSTLDVHGTGIHINGTVLRAMSAIGTVASGTYIKLCDFSALPATTSGVCAIRIRWGTGTGSGTYYYWQGHATGIVGYNTYGDGNGTYNGSGVEPLTLNHHYHYRTVGALSFRIDSDASGTSYGRHSIYMAPNASIDSMSFEVIAMPLRR